MAKQILKYEDTHKIINGMIYKLCNICNEWLLMDEDNFYINKKNKSDGFYPSCIECNKFKAIQWKKDNSEKAKEIELKKII